ncbi:MAG: hypothetical protein ABH803_02255 [Candidatus Micrarchaeota archaeon]
MSFTAKQLRLLKSLNTPRKITDFVEKLDYNLEENGDTAFSPIQVLEKRKAHCLEAAVFAACAFKINKKPALLMDLRAVRDEDHVLCVYKQDGRWGCIAKSKFTGLSSRDAVYSSLRELAMSFFSDYYNYAGEKTLREYSKPINLSRFPDWMTTLNGVDFIADYLDSVKHYSLINKKTERNLTRVKGKYFKAGLVDTPKKT